MLAILSRSVCCHKVSVEIHLQANSRDAFWNCIHCFFDGRVCARSSNPCGKRGHAVDTHGPSSSGPDIQGWMFGGLGFAASCFVLLVLVLILLLGPRLFSLPPFIASMLTCKFRVGLL